MVKIWQPLLSSQIEWFQMLAVVFEPKRIRVRFEIWSYPRVGITPDFSHPTVEASGWNRNMASGRSCSRCSHILAALRLNS